MGDPKKRNENVNNYSVKIFKELLPAGQLNVSANSGEFDTEPITRKLGGECGSFSI